MDASVVGADLVRRRPSRAELAAAGRERREIVPPEAHAELADRPASEAMALLAASDPHRLPELVPVRYGRMARDPFSYLRGAAGVMAADLGPLPRSGIAVQLCGDAHLANFGVFRAPDRRLVFDLNDFDETLAGPFEWDLKRLVASAAVAGRHLGLGRKACRSLVGAVLSGYRRATTVMAARDPLDVWYLRVELDRLLQQVGATKAQRRRARSRAERRDRLGALTKLTEVVDGRRRIVERPPLVTHGDGAHGIDLARAAQCYEEYRSSLQAHHRLLLDRYSVVDVARKVVGVGSVGTRCLVALLESGDGEPLFLQLKQASASVLEPHLGASSAETHGRRVVEGQRIIQSATDDFLGWGRLAMPDGDLDFYFRQLWDGKLSVDVASMGRSSMETYLEVCGAALARAHARSGDAAAIDGYLGDDDRLDRALTAFAESYADRTEQDHAALVEAIRSGQVAAEDR